MLPEQEATTDAPLSISEAVTAYSQTAQEADDGQSDTDEGEEGEPLDTETEGDADGEDEEQTDDEGQPDDDAEGEEEGEAEEGEEPEEIGGGKFAADDAKVRMPDGSFATIAELKSGNLMQRDYTQKTMAIAEERKALESRSEAIQQTQQQLQERLDFNVRLLQSLMPEVPSLATDPMGHMQAKEYRENLMAHLQYIQQQQEEAKQAATAKQQEATMERITSEFAALVQKVPDFRDQAKLNAFEADLVSHGAAYGFTRDEIANLVPRDHRMALAMRDAMAWRKLQASKTQVMDKNPAPKRPPVQKGGKRMSAGNIQAREANSAMERLNKTGSLRDGVAALLANQKKG